METNYVLASAAELINCIIRSRPSLCPAIQAEFTLLTKPTCLSASEIDDPCVAVGVNEYIIGLGINPNKCRQR